MPTKRRWKTICEQDFCGSWTQLFSPFEMWMLIMCSRSMPWGFGCWDFGHVHVIVFVPVSVLSPNVSDLGQAIGWPGQKNLSIYPSIHTRPSIIYPSIWFYLYIFDWWHLCIHLSIYPSINPSIHLLIHPIIRLSIYLSIRHLSLQPSLHIYIYISFHFYVYVSLRCECTISLSRDISWVWAVLCMFFAIIQSGFIYLVLK